MCFKPWKWRKYVAIEQNRNTKMLKGIYISLVLE